MPMGRVHLSVDAARSQLVHEQLHRLAGNH
jgi:hypothetical protein